jgi:hypothetical protein
MSIAKSYYLENIPEHAAANPRTFLQPTEQELNKLQKGKFVRLFFVLNFETADNCRAERMWVEIKDIEDDHFTGYLTNQPAYIQELHVGDVISFTKDHIASILFKPFFDETKKALISLRALENRQVNWLLKDAPNNPQDSGWQLFYGDEDPAYMEDISKIKIISLEEAMEFEPRLEKVFASQHHAFEWDQSQMDFIEVHD